jgi:hypothetical protein
LIDFRFSPSRAVSRALNDVNKPKRGYSPLALVLPPLIALQIITTDLYQWLLQICCHETFVGRVLWRNSTMFWTRMSNFSLYFSGSCILPTKILLLLALTTLAQALQNYMLLRPSHNRPLIYTDQYVWAGCSIAFTIW